ncbi:DUF3558 domain-containing protein [Amycolatopsis suaedae]|uniref:DUF3558 domain-containing protein n=1 Tax=Amycolatopsis suaedae TaxID=2510978 RepID=UPI0013EF072C|nr:DUF3558 domain-containing protein [Amycolatopsis suaedae]
MAAVGGVLLVVTACGGGQPKAAPLPPQPPAETLPAYGAPKVEHPLDVGPVEKVPCEVLTPEQVESLSGSLRKPPSTEEHGAAGLACVWVFEQSGSITVGPNMNNVVKGLSTIYEARERGQLEVFRPLEPIRGYPAVHFAQVKPAEGSCDIAIGISDDRQYLVGTSLSARNPHRSDPCGLAVRAGEMIVEHLKGRQ